MIFLHLALLALGFVMLIKGADWFVDGCSNIATSVGIPQIIVGLTIVAMGTSMPEAAVSIAAAAKSTADIAVGNIIGSNIINILVILGCTASLIPIAIHRDSVRIDIPLIIVITVLLLGVGYFDGNLSRTDGMILFGVFSCYMLFLFMKARKSMKEMKGQQNFTAKSLLMNSGLAIIGAAIVVLGSNIAVDAAVNIAKIAGLSEKIIGLTIVALGTSLPELVTSVTAARKGNADMAMGNIIGSNIFNILFVLGISSMIVPIPFAQNFFTDAVISILCAALLLVYGLAFGKLTRTGGFIMLAAYLGYFAYLFV